MRFDQEGSTHVDGDNIRRLGQADRQNYRNRTDVSDLASAWKTCARVCARRILLSFLAATHVVPNVRTSKPLVGIENVLLIVWPPKMVERARHNLKIEAILESGLYSSPPLMPVVVAKLTGTKQDIPHVFALTKDVASVAELKHLRRIRELGGDQVECIICTLGKSEDIPLVSTSEIDRFYQTYGQRIQEMEKEFAPAKLLKDFRIALVPREAPRTEHQLAACKSLWPCKYAKNNYLIRCIAGSVFDQAERLVVEIVTNKLMQHIDATGCSKTSGAVIFRCAQVYGVGLSCRQQLDENPTKHSAMLAIDSVAQNAGSSAWQCHGQEEEELQSSIQQELDSRPELAEHKIEADFLPYLCTNYDIILTEEPCMMCTMGLVQSRIRRLFFLSRCNEAGGQAGPRQPICYPDGAIETFMIHRDRSLNHRFEAWRIKLVDK